MWHCDDVCRRAEAVEAEEPKTPPVVISSPDDNYDGESCWLRVTLLQLEAWVSRFLSLLLLVVVPVRLYEHANHACVDLAELYVFE